jgi:hypothetical protein
LPHAFDRLADAQEDGYEIDEATVIDIVRRPQNVLAGHSGRLIAQSPIDDSHLIRVVFEENGEIIVVTVYPASRRRYEV